MDNDGIIVLDLRGFGKIVNQTEDCKLANKEQDEIGKEITELINKS